MKEMRDKLVKMGRWSADSTHALSHDAARYSPEMGQQPVSLKAEKYVSFFHPTHRELTLGAAAVPNVDLKLAA